MKNIEQTLRDITTQLEQADVYFGHGTERAIDEAAYVIAHVTGIPLDFDDSYLTQEITREQYNKILDIIQQRINTHKPVAYITNEAWFAGLRFYVDERVLVPRSPIAELVIEQFEPWLNASHVSKILDLCTGSGCIGIACAYAFPDAMVRVSDIDKNALTVARKNIEMHSLNERVQVSESDLFSAIPAQKYDIIVSNPPYVDAADMTALPAEYRHEPQHGLAAGGDGLDFVETILRTSSGYLSADGILVVEVGNSAEALTKKYPAVPFTWLEFEFGGDGVFLLTAEQLAEHFVC